MPRTKKIQLDSNTQEPAVADATDMVQPDMEAKSSVPNPVAKDTPEKEVLIQYGGGEWSVFDLEEKAVAAYVAEGHCRGRICGQWR